MIPVPIALLSLFYGVVAAFAAANAWEILNGASQRPLVWPLLWLGLCAGAMVGLPMGRAWGRTLAVAAAWWLTLSSLATAAWFVRLKQPLVALLVTFTSALYILVIRYLGRPEVKDYFHEVPRTSQGGNSTRYF